MVIRRIFAVNLLLFACACSADLKAKTEQRIEPAFQAFAQTVLKADAAKESSRQSTTDLSAILFKGKESPTLEGMGDADSVLQEGGDNDSALNRVNFTNPILADGSDPWVIQKDGYYYYCVSDNDNSIFVAKTKVLSDLASVPLKRIWQAPPGLRYSKETWAPELHFLDGRWYVYFTAGDGSNASHRMFVLESVGADAQGGYGLKDEIQTKTWAIDGTILKWGQRSFLIWSGWAGTQNIQQNLYIAPMKNPWTLETNIAFRQRLEAEWAQLSNAFPREAKGASNGQVVGKIDFPDSSLTFQVNVPYTGTYAIDIAYGNGSEGAGSDIVTINNGAQATVRLPFSGWENRQVVTRRFNLNAGSNSIRLGKGDLYAEIDYIEVKSIGIDPVVIAVPEDAWERRGGPAFVNEGPTILQNGNKTMIIYSAAGSWTDDYGLGQLTLVGSDPMDSQSWRKEGAVFQSANDVWGPGHASFAKSPDGKQDWIIYHAAKYKGGAWTRNVRLQPFQWKADGSPNFGNPVPVGQVLNFPTP